MTDASKPNPARGEECSEQCDWESLGRELAERELERHFFELREEAIGVSQRIARGDDLRFEDLDDLEHAHRQIGYFLRVLEEHAAGGDGE